jgi:fatty acid desaturase
MSFLGLQAMSESSSNEPAQATSRADTATSRADIVELHHFDHWPAKWMWPMVFAMVALGAAAAEASEGYWPLLLLIWPALSALLFVFVIAFHDASHGRLHPVHFMNEMYGHLVGTITLTPLNVYRYAHARHHAQLARAGDPELWPFNVPNISRPLRVLAAMAEIFLGLIYTPLLFLRSVLVGKLTPRERRLIVTGYVASALVWTVILAVTYDFNLWRILITAMLVPMALSAMLQTLNKYEQHLGLHGQSVLGLTRTVVDEHPATELVSAAMLYNDYHGTHHRYAKIPYYRLPTATPYTLAGAREHAPVFPSVISASIDMLRCLADPKVGPQWLTEPASNEPQSHADRNGSPRDPSAPVPQPVFTGAYND